MKTTIVDTRREARALSPTTWSPSSTMIAVVSASESLDVFLRFYNLERSL